jgi:hypothetical protein
MTIITITSREINQDIGRAKRAVNSNVADFQPTGAALLTP